MIIFEKIFESDGGARGKPRGPGNTTLWVIFQKNNEPQVRGVYNIYLLFYFFQTFSWWLPNERVAVVVAVVGAFYVSARTIHLSRFESFRIIHIIWNQILLLLCVGPGEKHLLSAPRDHLSLLKIFGFYVIFPKPVRRAARQYYNIIIVNTRRVGFE